MTLFRKRLVRVHLKDKETTIEGVLLKRWAGHHILAVAKVLEAADRTHDLDGRVSIPNENILFTQELR